MRGWHQVGSAAISFAIDRICKYVYAEVQKNKTKSDAAVFVRNLLAVVPYRIHTILTDNGAQFTSRRREHQNAAAYDFEKKCREHRLIMVYRPWTNGQMERVNRTIREATMKRYF